MSCKLSLLECVVNVPSWLGFVVEDVEVQEQVVPTMLGKSLDKGASGFLLDVVDDTVLHR